MAYDSTTSDELASQRQARTLGREAASNLRHGNEALGDYCRSQEETARAAFFREQNVTQQDFLIDEVSRKEKYIADELIPLTQQIIITHKSTLDRLNNTVGPGSINYRLLKSRLDDADASVRKVVSEVHGRPIAVSSFTIIYAYLYFSFFVAIETIVNVSAISALIGTTRFYSGLIALFTAVVFSSFAHFIGKSLRQWPRQPISGHLETKPTFSGVFVRLVAIFILLSAFSIAVYVLAKVRQEAYLRSLFDNELDDYLAVTGGRTWVRVIDVPFAIRDYTFITINFLALKGGILMSFLRHDPHPDYEQALKKQLISSKKFEKKQQFYEQVVAQENANYEEVRRAKESEISKVNSEVGASRTKIRDIETEKEAFLQRQVARIYAHCTEFARGFNETRDQSFDPASPKEPADIEEGLRGMFGMRVKPS